MGYRGPLAGLTRGLAVLLAAGSLAGCGGEDGAGGESEDVFYHYHDFEEVTVSLRTPKPPPRILRVTFRFEIDAADKDDALKAIEDNRRMIRDGMILFLSEQSIEKINDKETLDRIRTEVRKIANNRLGQAFVKRVFLKELAVH